MRNIFKTIVFLFVGVFVFRYWAMHRNKPEAANPADAAPLAKVSPYGFTPISLAGLPTDKVCVIAPQYCSSEEGRRADEITQQLTSEGIPCIRVSNVSLTFDHQPSQAELDRSKAIMTGRVPIIVINGWARNSPETSDVVSEFRSR
jgi:hypothetical protein